MAGSRNLNNPVGTLGIAIGIIVALFILFSDVFVEIGPGQRGVLMNWGAVQSGVLEPGLHMKIPLMQSVAKLDVQIQNSQAAETSASQDLQNVTTTVAVNWHIQGADAEWVYQNIGFESALVTRIIQPAISNAVKAVTAHYGAESLITERDGVRSKIEDEIRTAMTPYRVIVDSVNIVDFSFSPEFAQAIEQKQVAQQHAQQASYDLEKAKVVAQQKIAEATGQAEAQKLLQQTISLEILQRLAIDKWDGHLPTVVGNSAIPFLGNLDVLNEGVSRNHPPQSPQQ